MKHVFCLVWALCLGALMPPAYALDDIVERRAPWPAAPAASHVSVREVIKGRQTVDHVLQARLGQKLLVQLKASHSSTYFNVMKTGAQEALFVGSTSGSRFETVLTESGDYTVRVYLMPSAARRGAQSRYTLDLSLTEQTASSALPAPGTKAFDKHLTLHGIGFHVQARPGGDGLSLVRITPSGLRIDNAPVEVSLPGAVRDAELGDLDVDGSPEVYVYSRSKDGEHLLAYASNKRASLSQIYLSDMTPAMKEGYRGHDEFAVVESRLARRFPLFTSADQATPTLGKMRQVRYRLVPGEASWILSADRVDEY